MTRRSEFTNERRSLFDSSATTYEHGRPGYPPELFRHLEANCGLGPGCRVLEIGPGPGQATGALLDAGAEVMAVEVGDEPSRRLRTRFDGYGDRLVVHTGEFESVSLPDRRFDLVVAATSFHWIAPDRGLARVARLLRSGGSVALWWHHFGDEARQDPFRTALQPLLRHHAPELVDEADGSGGSGIGAHPYALDAEARRAEIAAVDHFGPVGERRFSWTAIQTAAEVRLFFSSFSNWMALDDAVRESLLDDIEDLVEDRFDGVVQRPFQTAVYHAARR